MFQEILHILLNSYLKGLVVNHLKLVIKMQNTIEEQTAVFKVFISVIMGKWVSH